MSRKPVIGIAGTLDTTPATSPFSAWKRDITNEAYTSSLVKAGATPILLPVVQSEIENLLDLCDGLLFPGGGDIHPCFYHTEKHGLCGETDERNDVFQLELFKEARKRNLPVLGICRGAQLINVALGGTLHQDYSLRSPTSLKHNHYQAVTEGFHTINLEQDSQLSKCFNNPSLWVNSLHHQQIDTLGTGLHIVAICEDGGIEAIEGKEGPYLLGVQWHPEAMMRSSEEMLPLFTCLVEKALFTIHNKRYS